MVPSKDRIVVIGAGIGGLACALRLAHAGADITVVEAAETPGGKMRTVESAAGPVDAGPTVLTLRKVFVALFDECGLNLDDHVAFDRLDVLARHFWPDGTVLDLHADPEASAAAVRAFAGPKAERQYRRFSATAQRLYSAFEGPMMEAAEPDVPSLVRMVAARPGLLRAMAPLSTMAARLSREFSDPRLAQLFGRYATYVGGIPHLSPAILRLVWHAESEGVWSVRGGMHRLAVALMEAAVTKGAAFRFGIEVARVETQQGRVAAVHLSDGHRLPCDVAVFNGDPRALTEGLMGTAARGAVAAEAVEPRSLSANVWTFAAAPEGCDLVHHNVFFCDDARQEFDPIARGDLPADPTLYVCAQDRAGGHRPQGPERFEIIMNAPPLPGGRPEDIETCRRLTFPLLASRGLRFSPEPGDATLTTPAGFEALFPGSRGSLYGRSPHGAFAALNRPRARTAVPGLYLAGGGAHPGAGVPMAALSGRHAAEAILTDLASTSTSRRTATRGGMSTASPTAAPAPSR